MYLICDNRNFKGALETSLDGKFSLAIESLTGRPAHKTRLSSSCWSGDYEPFPESLLLYLFVLAITFLPDLHAETFHFLG